MQKRVVKFGGSNLKSREDIQKLVHTISRYTEPLVVVVSAFYGITNYLTEGLEAVVRLLGLPCGCVGVPMICQLP